MFSKWSASVIWVIIVMALIIMTVILIMNSVQPDDSVMQQTTFKAERGDVARTVFGYGTIVSSKNSVVLTQTEGTIKEIYVLPGNYINLDRPILQLENPQLQQKLDELGLKRLEADADLRSAEAKLRRDILQAEITRDEASLDLEFTKQKLAMRKELYEKKIISRLEYLQSESDLNKAQLRIKHANKSYAEIIISGEFQLESHKLRISGALTRIENTKNNISNLTVKTDTEGVLTSLEGAVEIGAYMQTGQVIARLASPNSQLAEINVSATDAGLLNIGLQASVTVGGDVILGEVINIDPTVVSGQVRAEISFLETLPEGTRENVDINAEILIKAVDDVIRVQKFSLEKGNMLIKAKVEGDDGIEYRDVQLGMIGSKYIEVINGISPGERLIIEP